MPQIYTDKPIQNVVCQHHGDICHYQTPTTGSSHSWTGARVVSHQQGGNGHLAPGLKAFLHAPKVKPELRRCLGKLHAVYHSQKERRGFELSVVRTLVCAHTDTPTDAHPLLL